ncbi:MAG: cell division protein FtsA [Rhodobacteraceae bacterium]|mgnify:FL=1|nr:MAG: cell division protein FtsA [Paracoccaceae bacterium]
MTIDFRRHRESRKKLRAAIRGGTLGLLDIGTSKIACLILKFAEGNRKSSRSEHLQDTKRLAYRVVGVATKKSRGIKSGEVVVADEVEKSIRSVVQQAQKMAATTIDDVLICFSGGSPVSKNLFGELKLETPIVETRDIGALLSKYDFGTASSKREILHAMPINFTLDDKTGLIDPCGLAGQTLGLDVNLMTVDQNALDNITQCFNRCQLGLAGAVFAPYASARSSLVEDELKLGSACVDMGSGSTGVSIFLNHQMVFGSTVKFGGEHITSDIMQAFKISFEEAERIKTLHGGVVITNLDDRDLIELSSGDKAEGVLNYDRPFVSRSELISVIRPRLEEILEEVDSQLDLGGFDHLPSKRIVFTGGGSQLPGFYELATDLFGSRVRIGRPMRIQGLPQALHGSQFSAIIGLAIEASYPQDEVWDFDMPFRAGATERFRLAVNWFKENW